jgi:hypothetical protein
MNIEFLTLTLVVFCVVIYAKYLSFNSKRTTSRKKPFKLYLKTNINPITALLYNIAIIILIMSLIIMLFENLLILLNS